MCYVNYVRESTEFIRHACDQGLTANERLLWYAIFDVMNSRAKGSDWPEGLIPIPNKRLLSLVPFGEDSMVAARNKLKQRGLIDFIPGKRNSAPPSYKMNYFFPELSRDNPHLNTFYPAESGNLHGNSMGNNRGNLHGNSMGNNRGRMPDIILNYKTNELNHSTKHAYDDDVDAAAEYARARNALELAIDQQFVDSFGYHLNPAEKNSIAMNAEHAQASMDLIAEAIGRAAVSNPKAPANYIGEILERWYRKGIRTIQDLVDSEYGFASIGVEVASDG